VPTGAPSPSEQEKTMRFRAMGSDVHVIVVGGRPGLETAGRRRIEHLERRWSRFLPDSEISVLNRRAGIPIRVSSETRLLIERAQEAFDLTGASFDPTVLGDVIRAGYDRPFDELAADAPARHSLLTTGCRDIMVTADAVRLPPGTGFDPGGIGKGLAADLVATELRDAGADGVCVNLGGDVRVRGIGPDGHPATEHDGWTVAVEHPWAPDPIALLGVRDGAVATSSTLRRAWTVGGQPRHHLIDPGTGQPSDSDLVMVTTVAANAWKAEVLAKAVLLRGSAHPFDLLGGTSVQAIAIDRDGAVQATDGMAAFLGDATLPDRIARPELGATTKSVPRLV
jgi:thiamine biosynthesis lipoprotein